MIDRILLAEALALFDKRYRVTRPQVEPIIDAARKYLTLVETFPTDEIVEAFKSEWSNGGSDVRAGLEAVRRVIGDG